jgi:hypothetical protein
MLFGQYQRERSPNGCKYLDYSNFNAEKLGAYWVILFVYTKGILRMDLIYHAQRRSVSDKDAHKKIMSLHEMLIDMILRK